MTSAAGPGIMVTSTPACMARRTRLKPGSEMPGVPALVTSATDWPCSSSAMIFSPARSSLCS